MNEWTNELLTIDQWTNEQVNQKNDVPEERLELSRDNSQRLLRPQRLPISPSGQLFRKE